MYGTGHNCPSGAVVLGSSFGGLKALQSILPGLPTSFPLPVIVVNHRRGPDALPRILRRRCDLPVDAIEPGYRLAAGRVAVAPPVGISRICEDGVVVAGEQAATRRMPDSVDRAFRAVAERFGTGAVAVVLTGRQADGADGVRLVKRAGGFVLVQDPADAAAPGMPMAALASGCADHRVPLRLIAPTLVAITMVPGARELLRVPAAPWATTPAAG
jgi:two-component system chemotaxis response regulator CheB